MSLFRATTAQSDDRNANERTTGGLDPNGRNAGREPYAADPQGRNPGREPYAVDPNGRNPGREPQDRNAGHEPYRISRVPDDRTDPIPDGPTQRIAERAVRRRPRGSLLVLAVAMLALNLAGVAGLLAWRALAVARATAAAGGHAAPATPGTATAPEAGDDYSVAYAQEPLRVQVGCSAVMFLDLDEPRANAGESVSDLRYDSRCGTQPPSLTLGPGASAGAQVSGGDIDAAGCGEAIRTSPLGPGASVEVKKGAALCVLTAANPPDMVLVEVTDVGRTGIAGMRATSWKVTG